MTALSTPRLDEVELVQNPALGGYAMWKFVDGYQGVQSSWAPIHLSFVVLPMVFHQVTFEAILSTRKASGLLLFASKLGSERDRLLAINQRARSMRGISTRSLGFAAHSGLVTVDYSAGLLRANLARARTQNPKLKKDVSRISDAAERLGHWCGELNLQQVLTTLVVKV